MKLVPPVLDRDLVRRHRVDTPSIPKDNAIQIERDLVLHRHGYIDVILVPMGMIPDVLAFTRMMTVVVPSRTRRGETLGQDRRMTAIVARPPRRRTILV